MCESLADCAPIIPILIGLLLKMNQLVFDCSPKHKSPAKHKHEYQVFQICAPFKICAILVLLSNKFTDL
jgi:hypothetical protein